MTTRSLTNSSQNSSKFDELKKSNFCTPIMVPGHTLVSLVPGASVVEVMDYHHEVHLSMPVNLMYNMSILEYS